MAGVRSLLLVLTSAAPAPAPTPQQLVEAHVRASANLTFREASGFLKFPYLVPGGPYDELWDWDSMFTGVALLQYGSAKYFEGSMLNFLDHTNLTTGQVEGCLLPSGDTGTIFHAKPVVIQGALLAAKHTGDFVKFKPFAPAMEALLDYWAGAARVDGATGLRRWYNQLESGEDNLVLSTCPSDRSPECWDPALHELVIASADLATFLFREHTALASFCTRWAAAPGTARDEKAALLARAAAATSAAAAISASVNEHLWSAQLGVYVALNTSTAGRHEVTNRVGVMGLPLFGGFASPTQAASLRGQLLAADMVGAYGVRSVSSLDPRYDNSNEIKPYSNWRGPVWVNENVMLSYGLMNYGYQEEAQELCDRVVGVLAADLEAQHTWHECYHADNGTGLAAAGFLSWNTLAGAWASQLGRGMDPFDLSVPDENSRFRKKKKMYAP